MTRLSSQTIYSCNPCGQTNMIRSARSTRLCSSLNGMSGNLDSRSMLSFSPINCVRSMSVSQRCFKRHSHQGDRHRRLRPWYFLLWHPEYCWYCSCPTWWSASQNSFAKVRRTYLSVQCRLPFVQLLQRIRPTIHNICLQGMMRDRCAEPLPLVFAFVLANILHAFPQKHGIDLYLHTWCSGANDLRLWTAWTRYPWTACARRRHTRQQLATRLSIYMYSRLHAQLVEKTVWNRWWGT